MEVPEELIETLTSSRLPVVVGHVTPDLDSLGAMLALAKALPSPDAAILLPVPLKSQKLKFMMELSGEVPVADAARLGAADVVIVVDTASVKRANVGGAWDSIAEKLVVSPSTVQTHRGHILQKLGLETTIDLVRHAIRHGFIEA